MNTIEEFIISVFTEPNGLVPGVQDQNEVSRDPVLSSIADVKKMFS